MKRPSKRWQILLAVTLLLYACGYLTQFIGNYAVWQKNGGMPGGTSPPFSSLTPLACLKGILWFPYSLYCMAGCAAAVAAIFLYRKLFSQDALTDSEASRLRAPQNAGGFPLNVPCCPRGRSSVPEIL